MFFIIYSKETCISDTKHDTSGNPNSSFHFGADVIDLSDLRSDKAIYSSLFFKFILSVRLNNSLWGSDVSLLLEFVNTVSILFCNFIELICYILF